MEVWGDIILIVLMLGLFIFGYFLVTRLDRFLDKNRKTIEKEEEKKEPSCVMLTEEMSDEEFVQEVCKFRKTHEGTRIILYDSSDTELSESMEYHAQHK